jgi:hypothetical protein
MTITHVVLFQFKDGTKPDLVRDVRTDMHFHARCPLLSRSRMPGLQPDYRSKRKLHPPLVSQAVHPLLPRGQGQLA